jgi:flavin reductase (DIM6/NTAB) family NADH-FMN oxidoreductase RutF
MFCANVMAHRHQEISRRFAVKGVDRFDGVEWEHRRTGPALSGAAAWVECVIEARHDAGDHEIVVCRVESIEGDPEVSPLVFLKGAYGRWADE